MHTVSGSISLPSQGFFSPFPHGTGSLSVNWEYLALGDGPPIFNQDSTCPDLLIVHLIGISDTGLSPAMAALSRAFSYPSPSFWAVPRSLAATEGISIDFFSFGYLDVSVPRVRLPCGILLIAVGFPIRTCPDQRLLCQLPEPFRRLLRPSSPPVAKASTVCTCSLDHITRKSLNFGSYVFYRTFYGTSLPYFTITRCLSQRTMICA
jgi:hypothetical protein